MQKNSPQPAKYASVSKNVLKQSRYGSEFQGLFPSAEYEIRPSKRLTGEDWEQV
jgi:hypothetical protein